MPATLFVPSPDQLRGEPRVDDPADIRDVLALVTVKSTELVIGLDIGRVIRVVGTRDLPPRAKAQLAAHERVRPRLVMDVDELYVMDVQVVEKQPDAPGADDPLFLYGVLRGPYPAALSLGVTGIDGQLATTRGPLLDGLARGIERAFAYETGECGASCTHAALPIDSDPSARAAVLAFPLVTMGEDGSNELVAAQLIHDVLGAMRTDLGDDLANDPVPVPNRKAYERELAAAGWTIKGDIATHASGKGRFASLFSPGKKQKLPREIKLAEYIPIVDQHLIRLPGWPVPVASELHARLGLRATRQRTPTSPGVPAAPQRPAFTPGRQRPPTPPPRERPPTSPGLPPPPKSIPPPSLPPWPEAPRARPPTPPPPPPQTANPRSKSRKKHARAQGGNKYVVPGLTAPAPKEWIRQLIEDHLEPERPRPRVTQPDRKDIPDWMFDPVDDDDDRDK